MKRGFLYVVVFCFCLIMTNTVSYAKEPDSIAKENGLVFNSGVKDESVATRKYSILDILKGKSNSITCNYSLNAYNDYTYMWAYSWTENGYMDRIYTKCTAYYDQGGLVGTDECDLHSGEVWACSATVQVPNTQVFNLRINSANSQHLFARANYNGVNKFLDWHK